MLGGVERLGDPPRGLEFKQVPLAVVDAEGMNAVTLGAGDSRRGR